MVDGDLAEGKYFMILNPPPVRDCFQHPEGFSTGADSDAKRHRNRYRLSLANLATTLLILSLGNFKLGQ